MRRARTRRVTELLLAAPLLGVLLLAAVGSARAGAEIVLRDGQILTGKDVQKDGAVYKLKLEDGRELSVPVALVRELRLSSERGEVTATPEGGAPAPAAPTQPGSTVSEPTNLAGGVMSRSSLPDGGVSAGNPVTPFAQWEPKSDWPKQGSEWPKSDWPKPEDPKTIWTPESSLKPDQSNFNPSTWSKSGINQDWTPTDGFRKQGTSMTEPVTGVVPGTGSYSAPPAGPAVAGLVAAKIPANALVAGSPTTPSATPVDQSGRASWYGARYRGRPMANGRPFDPEAFTAAHASLPLGTLVRVVATESRQGVVAEITDRMPRRPGRVLLLSEGAARAIGLHEMGVAEVEFERLTSPPPPLLPPASPPPPAH